MMKLEKNMNVFNLLKSVRNDENGSKVSEQKQPEKGLKHLKLKEENIC